MIKMKQKFSKTESPKSKQPHYLSKLLTKKYRFNDLHRVKEYLISGFQTNIILAEHQNYLVQSFIAFKLPVKPKFNKSVFLKSSQSVFLHPFSLTEIKKLTFLFTFCDFVGWALHLFLQSSRVQHIETHLEVTVPI